MRNALRIAVLAAAVLAAGGGRADQALELCEREATLAAAVLQADVILRAELLEMKEEDKTTERGWEHTWTIQIKPGAALLGAAPAETRFTSTCTGLVQSSRNHCMPPPGKKGDRVVLFFKKVDGKLAIDVPRPGALPGACPGAKEIAEARAKRGEVFKQVLQSK